jgi:hypothetical protein
VERPPAGVGRAVQPRSPADHADPERRGVEDAHLRAGQDVLGLLADRVLQDNLKYNSVTTAGSGVRLRVLDANADRSVYTVQVDEK